MKAKFLTIFILLLGGLVFLALAQAEQSRKTYPDPKEFTPNLWFDSEEKYYPTNPLDFYYDKELNELGGKEAKAAYDALSQDEKLKSFKVFYNIEESGSELVYQYWLFYVFNEGEINEHYGDWEAVHVFVDRDSYSVEKLVASAHNGTQMKATLANNELAKPELDNTTIFVELGSHANAPDGNGDGLFNNMNPLKKAEDVSNWINAYGIWTWSSYDRLHGLKVPHDSPYYDLRPISEIKDIFGKKYGEERPLITKEKSPTLGMLPIKIGAKKIHALPLGGSPPQNAWLKKEYKNPEEVVPLTPTRLAKKVDSFFSGIGSAIAGVGKSVDLPETKTKFLKSSVGESLPKQESNVLPSVLLDETEQNVSARSPSLPAREETGDVQDVRGLTPQLGGQTPTESDEVSSAEPELEIALVKRVIDGDTIELATGERVRYIGIDAPENLLECYAEEARERNKSLVEEKQIILLKALNHSDKDKYDRLLRFVWLDYYQDGKIDSTDTFVNLDLIEKGYARENDYAEAHEYKHRFQTAEAEAKRLELGLWGNECNKKIETVKETAKDVIQTAEKIIAFRPFEISPNVFQFPPSYYGSPASSPASSPAPSQDPAPQATTTPRVVINEIQTGDAEFVELYNQFSTSKSLAGYYFSYYSSTKTAWNDPHRNKQFPDGATIPANGYYLIGLKDYPTSGGNPNSDWQPYTSAQLSNTAGTIAIFPFDPSATTSSAAYNGRADAVGWGTGITLYEQSPAAVPDSGKSITRNSTHNDTDNNASDFSQSASSTPINSSGMGYDPNFSYVPLWAMYQKDAKHSGLAALAGPAWTSSSQASSSWTFQMKDSSGANAGGRSQAVIDYAGNVYAADASGIVHKINASGVEQWTFNPDDQAGVGAGYAASSPALSSDSSRVYSVYTDNTERKLWLFAIKTSDGTLDWKYAPSEDGYGQDLSSPIVDSSNNIYYASMQSIYSVSSTGSLRWEKNLSPSRLGLKIPAIDNASGHIYAQGIVTLSAGDRYIWKLNTSDGSEVWKVNPIGNNSLSNGVSIGANGTIYTGGNADSRLYSVNPTDGSKNWSVILTSGSVKGPIPSFDSAGNIYAGSSGAFNSGALNKVNATGTLLWAFTVASLGASSHPAVTDSNGRVYFGAKDKFVYALNGEDGSEIWKYELDSEPVGFAVGKDVVYAVSYNGKVYALK